MSEQMIIDSGNDARLKWAFTTIHQFMLEHGLAVLTSKEYCLVVTDIADCVLEEFLSSPPEDKP